jgi:alpha-beta hydrolase superfamily lysophospholipase
MEAKQRSTGREMFVGVTRVLSDEESKAFFETVKARHPEMDVKIPFLTVREMLQYKPKTFATDVTAPTLVVVAGQDRVNPPEQGVALFEAVGARRKELHVEPEAKHYDLYEAPFFNGIVERQIGWLRQILMAPR